MIIIEAGSFPTALRLIVFAALHIFLLLNCPAANIVQLLIEQKGDEEDCCPSQCCFKKIKTLLDLCSFHILSSFL